MAVRGFFLAAMLVVGSAGTLAQIGGIAGNCCRTPDAPNNGVLGSKERPVRVSSGVMMGLLVHKVDPVIPKDAVGVGGIVMAATIDDQGKIVKLSVSAGPEGLRESVLDAVHQWTYKPYLLNGKPVFVQTQIVINVDRGR